jgi:Domain of unknown function (DUF4918)
MPSTIAAQLIQFYKTLSLPGGLPAGVNVLFPQSRKEVMQIVKTFFDKYYSDHHSRQLIFGINPGRLGGGITGINFTAPRQLKDNCGIDHSFGNSSELSAEFIYEVIEKYGGPAAFYHDYFISAVSPLGFTKEGVNMNYYDDKKLQQAITPFVLENIQKQLAFGFKRDRCICIGGEKNFKFFQTLNKEHGFFKTIIPLPHPRFILQYRRKQKESYIRQYMETLQS